MKTPTVSIGSKVTKKIEFPTHLEAKIWAEEQEWPIDTEYTIECSPIDGYWRVYIKADY